MDEREPNNLNKKNEQESEKSKFISERIVPKKKYKKYLWTGLCVALSAVVFGVIAAITFYLTDGAMVKNMGGSIETFVIARDETTTEAETETTEEETTREENQSEESTEIPRVYEADDVESIEKARQKIYEQMAKSIVTVNIVEAEGEDWFHQETTSHIQQFGVIVYDMEDVIYILTDGANLGGESIHVIVDGRVVPATVMGKDDVTNLSVLGVKKSELGSAKITAAVLGNSYETKQGDFVVFAGSPFGQTGAVSYGIVSLRQDNYEFTDGSIHIFCTDLSLKSGCSGILLNSQGEIIGWASDKTQVFPGTTSAFGISNLKYLIEDLCAGRDTAYLGIKGTEVSVAFGAELGLEAGYYIQDVIENSPAYNSGMQVGDRIVSIAGKQIHNSRELLQQLDILNPEDAVTAVIQRSNGAEQVSVTLSLILGAR